jgi:ABC-type glycerol-3-phosphate transport system substrate-binding protein
MDPKIKYGALILLVVLVAGAAYYFGSAAGAAGAVTTGVLGVIGMATRRGKDIEIVDSQINDSEDAVEKLDELIDELQKENDDIDNKVAGMSMADKAKAFDQLVEGDA